MRYAVISFLLLFSFSLSAQKTITGRVMSRSGQKALSGANVFIKSNKSGTVTDENGKFQLQYQSEEDTLVVRFVGYETFEKKISSITDKSLYIIFLQERSFMSETVLIEAIRQPVEEATSVYVMDSSELQGQNLGRDIPLLLESTPSLLTTSDAGNGMGYTQFRIRGMDLTRINVTVNGIPINDQESHGVWWVNMPDLASSVNSIEVQRGVGSSTNGGQAFGSSVNIRTLEHQKEAYSEISGSYGSYNSYKTNVLFGTGIMDNGWAFSGRLSKLHSDGYIDRASTDLKSYFFSAGYHGDKQLLKFTAFSGQERTYQAWYGVSEDDLTNNRRSNVYTYEDQTDNYQQDHYQLHYSRELSPAIKLNTALHYTYGRGYYEEFRDGDALASHGIANDSIGDTVITQSDIIRRRWLDNHFYGGTYSLIYNQNLGYYNKLKLTLGGNYNQYLGDHFGEVIWARYASNSSIDEPYYFNDSYKRNVNNYLKLQFEGKRLKAGLEMQVRSVRYSIGGLSDNLLTFQDSVNYLFVNPRAHIAYQTGDHSNLYFFYGRSVREPVRSDFVDIAQEDQPEPEIVHDFELGYDYRKENINFSANVYYMHFINQLVANGQLNDVGAYLRVNVPQSYRRGIELLLNAKIGDGIRWQGNLNLSQNRIVRFENYVEQYDADFNYLGQKVEDYKQTPISFSPSAIAYSRFDFDLLNGLNVAFMSKFVGRQFLDNTGSIERSIDPYLVHNALINYEIGNGKYFDRLLLTFAAYNIANELYEGSGWTWRYEYAGEMQSLDYYYPQAERNFMFGIRAKF